MGSGDDAPELATARLPNGRRQRSGPPRRRARPMAQCRPCIRSPSPRSEAFPRALEAALRRVSRRSSCTGRRPRGTACRASRSRPSSRSATCATSRSRATRCASGARSRKTSPLLPFDRQRGVARERDYGARRSRAGVRRVPRRAREDARAAARPDRAAARRVPRCSKATARSRCAGSFTTCAATTSSISPACSGC